MLKKLHDNNKIWFAVIWIIIYCVFMSIADSVSSILQIEKSITLIVGLILSIIVLVFLKNNKLFESYGLCVPKTSSKSMLFYIPLLLIITANFWNGFTLNYSVVETILYILSMFCVGFLEEIIFRGFLFESIKQDNVKLAIIISSITFGIGHIINMINGSGAELLPNLLQVIYATAAGFMFVMIYYKSNSLLTCIATHSIFNALNAFSKESTTLQMQIISASALTIIAGGYAIYLAVSVRKNNHRKQNTLN